MAFVSLTAAHGETVLLPFPSALCVTRLVCHRGEDHICTHIFSSLWVTFLDELLGVASLNQGNGRQLKHTCSGDKVSLCCAAGLGPHCVACSSVCNPPASVSQAPGWRLCFSTLAHVVEKAWSSKCLLTTACSPWNILGFPQFCCFGNGYIHLCSCLSNWEQAVICGGYSDLYPHTKDKLPQGGLEGESCPREFSQETTWAGWTGDADADISVAGWVKPACSRIGPLVTGTTVLPWQKAGRLQLSLPRGQTSGPETSSVPAANHGDPSWGDKEQKRPNSCITW